MGMAGQSQKYSLARLVADPNPSWLALYFPRCPFPAATTIRHHPNCRPIAGKSNSQAYNAFKTTMEINSKPVQSFLPPTKIVENASTKPILRKIGNERDGKSEEVFWSANRQCYIPVRRNSLTGVSALLMVHNDVSTCCG